MSKYSLLVGQYKSRVDIGEDIDPWPFHDIMHRLEGKKAENNKKYVRETGGTKRKDPGHDYLFSSDGEVAYILFIIKIRLKSFFIIPFRSLTSMKKAQKERSKDPTRKKKIILKK